MKEISSVFVDDFKAALNGVKGEFDAWLECYNEVEVKAAINGLVAERDAEIMEQCRLNGMGSAREAALLGQIERLKTEISKCYAAFNPSDRFKKRLIELHEEQSTALKLAREALMHDGYPCGNGCKCRACEALAAIDALGEVK